MRPGRLARPRAGAAQRFLRPPGLLFHARPRDWSRRPESHRHGQSRPAGFESAVSTFQPRRGKLVRTEGVAPSRACAHRILAPARIRFRHIRKNWSIHRDVRPAFCLTKTVRRFLRVGCENGRSGRTRTFEVRRGRRVYSALQLLLCHASTNGGSGGIRTRDRLLMRELR